MKKKELFKFFEIIKLVKKAEIAYKKGELIKEFEILKELGIAKTDL